MSGETESSLKDVFLWFGEMNIHILITAGHVVAQVAFTSTQMLFSFRVGSGIVRMVGEVHCGIARLVVVGTRKNREGIREEVRMRCVE